MNKFEDDAKCIDEFAREINKLAEYVRTNPDNKTEDELQDIIIMILEFQLKFLTTIKENYPSVFKFIKKKN